MPAKPRLAWPQALQRQPQATDLERDRLYLRELAAPRGILRPHRFLDRLLSYDEGYRLDNPFS